MIFVSEYSDDEYITYFYDDLGQLLRETNSVLGFIYTYTYDNAGNITSVKREVLEENDDGLIQMGVIGEGAETNGLLPILPLVITNTYSYTDSEWGDLLTAYNGVTLTYDEIGNPLSYYNGSSYSFTWQGRRLVTATKGSKNMSFSYNDEGLRVSKTVNGVITNYYYQGTLLIAEETNSNIIVYLYDENGTPVGFMYRAVSYAEDVWDIYAFEKNIFGDVVAVYNADTGVKLISYTYGAWGDTVTSYHNGGGSTTATKNPYKYRGYYYDSDLAMYYLQTRYYDPAICRFINADSALYDNLLGYNLFVYCGNNPVNLVDYNGKTPAAVLTLALAEPTLLGELILAGAIAVVGGVLIAKNISAIFNYLKGKSKDKTPESSQPLNDSDELDIEYPGDDPTIAPEGYEWRGRGEQGSREGSYYNPENNSSLHPDLNHPDPVGPHWDYNGPEGKFRIYPDGSIAVK